MRASYDDYHSLSIIYSLQSHARARARTHTRTCTHMYTKPHFFLLFLSSFSPLPPPFTVNLGALENNTKVLFCFLLDFYFFFFARFTAEKTLRKWGPCKCWQNTKGSSLSFVLCGRTVAFWRNVGAPVSCPRRVSSHLRGSLMPLSQGE